MRRLTSTSAVAALLAGTCLTAQANAQDATGPDAATAGQAPAQAAEPVESGEVVVTATRRSEAISRVPISVVALSRDRMDDQGIRSITDIVRFTPSVNLQPNGFSGRGTRIAIRGISSSIGPGTTGIYIDDTPIQVRAIGAGNNAVNPYPQVFDLDRVEVLRGPQGTLFGAGSEGGTIRFITATPSLTQTSGYGRAEASLTAHGAPSYEAGLAFGTPLIDDRVGLRVSGWYRRTGGYVDRVDYRDGSVIDRNANSGDAVVLRAALTARLSDALTVTPSIYFQDVDIADTSQYWERLSDPKAGRFRNGDVIAQPSSDRFVLPSLKIEYDGGPLSIVSVTSYLDRKLDVRYDYTSAVSTAFLGNAFQIFPGFVADTPMNDRQRSFTQEVRVQTTDPDAPIRATVGAFYSNARQTAVQRIIAPGLGLLTNQYGLTVDQFFGVPLLGTLGYRSDDSGRDEQIALFGEGSVRVADGVRVTAGARVARTSFAFTNLQQGPLNGGTTGNSGKLKETPFTPKIGVTWEPNDRTLLYVSAAKGFRIGGANTPVPTNRCATDLAAVGIPQAPATYGSDNVWSYEVGAKRRFQRFSVSASVFRIDWKNIQQSVSLPTCGFQYVANLGAARSQGFDLQVEARPLPGLTLSGSLAYTHAQYLDTVLGGVVAGGGRAVLAQRGSRIEGSPWQATASAEYRTTVAAGTPFYLRGDFSYNSRNPGPLVGTDPATVSYDPTIPIRPAQSLASLRAGIVRGGVDLSLFVDNVFDVAPLVSRWHDQRTSTLFKATTVRPRTFGLTAVYRY